MIPLDWLARFPIDGNQFDALARSPVDEVERLSVEVGQVPLVADLHHCLHEEAEIATSSGRRIFEPIGPCLILPSLDEPVLLPQFQPVRQGGVGDTARLAQVVITANAEAER